MLLIPFDKDQWEWNSRTNYPDGTKRPFNVDKVMIHWGGRTFPGDPSWSLEEQVAYEMRIIRGWQRYHIDVKGWTDIGYGYATGNSGLIYRLRGENRSGAQRGDYDGDGIPENEEARAIVWIGGLGYVPSKAAFDAMGRIINADPLPVWIHRDGKATQCPGDDWEAYRDARKWVDAPVVLPPTTGGYEMQTIRKGDGFTSKGTGAKRSAVRAAQAMAKGHGFKDENTSDTVCGIDGKFWTGTEKQIKDFQEARGLVIDGVVGPTTWSALEG